MEIVIQTDAVCPSCGHEEWYCATNVARSADGTLHPRVLDPLIGECLACGHDTTNMASKEGD